MNKIIIISVVACLSLFSFQFNSLKIKLDNYSLVDLNIALAEEPTEVDPPNDESDEDESDEKSWWEKIVDYFTDDSDSGSDMEITSGSTEITIEKAYGFSLTITNANGDSISMEADSIEGLEYEVDSVDWSMDYPDFGDIGGILKTVVK